MQWSLFLLSLMGQCSFFTCHPYEYHFIREKKTWNEAQKYCREKHTDLAIVYDKTNVTDMMRLCGSASQGKAWIGLYKIPGQVNKTWHWSLPGVEFKKSETEWFEGEPNDFQGNENCVWIEDQKLNDACCATKCKFICYKETGPPSKTLHLINTTMTWLHAQSHCREHYTDLVSGPVLKELRNETQSKENHWIGLFRDDWTWSDESRSSFRNWVPESFNDKERPNICAMTVLHRFGKWEWGDCSETKPFFCYDVTEKLILIKQNKTWEEALTYCREKHRDLVSILNIHQQKWVEKKTKKADTAHVWLGLRYTCTLGFWFWVSDEVVNYKNWALENKTDDCNMSAAMHTGGEHKWLKKDDAEKFNFICAVY